MARSHVAATTPHTPAPKATRTIADDVKTVASVSLDRDSGSVSEIAFQHDGTRALKGDDGHRRHHDEADQAGSLEERRDRRGQGHDGEQDRQLQTEQGLQLETSRGRRPSDERGTQPPVGHEHGKGDEGASDCDQPELGRREEPCQHEAAQERDGAHRDPSRRYGFRPRDRTCADLGSIQRLVVEARHDSWVCFFESGTRT